MRSERKAPAGRLGPASGGLRRWLRQRVREPHPPKDPFEMPAVPNTAAVQASMHCGCPLLARSGQAQLSL